MYKLKYEIDFEAFYRDDPILAEKVEKWISKCFDEPFIHKEGEWYIADRKPELFIAITHVLFEQDWAVKYLKTLVRDYGDGEYDEIHDFIMSNCEGTPKWKIRKEGV